MAVIADRVICPAHTQTRHGSGKEAAEHIHIFPARCLIPRLELRVQEVRCDEESKGAEEMRVDIHSLIVDIEKGLPGFGVRIRLRAVAGGNVVIVLLPGGDFVPEKCQFLLDFLFDVGGLLFNLFPEFFCGFEDLGGCVLGGVHLQSGCQLI